MSYIPNISDFQTPQQLYQGEVTTSAISVYSPSANEEVVITAIYLSNTSNVDKWFSIWHDEDGTTYDDTTILYNQVDVAKNTTSVIQSPIYLKNSSGNIAVQGQTNNTVTMTIYGIVTDIS